MPMGMGAEDAGPRVQPPGSDAARPPDRGDACDEAGAERACFVGEAAHAGVGACVMGHQRCTSNGEFGAAWGACEGSGRPSTEIEGNGVDDDCDGQEPVTLCSALGATAPNEAWRATFDRYDGSRRAWIDGTAADRDGNVVIAGHFWERLVFDMPGADSLELMGTPGTTNRFVIKMASDGSVVWHKEWMSSDYYYFSDRWGGGGNSVAIDAMGRVFVTGHDRLASGELAEGGMVVLALSPGGDQLWQREFGTGIDGYSDGWRWHGGVALDHEGNLYFASVADRTVSFDEHELVTTTPRYFIASLDPEGDARYARFLAPEGVSPYVGYGGGLSVISDREGRAYVTFPATGSVTIDGTAIEAGPSGGVVLMALDATGETRYVRGYATGWSGWSGWWGEGGGWGRSIAVDGNGNVYMHGGTSSPIDFGGEPIGTGSTGYIVSFDRDGAHRWSRGTDTYDSFRGFWSGDIVADEAGSVYYVDHYRDDDLRLVGLGPDGAERFSREIDVDDYDNDKWGSTSLAIGCGGLYLTHSGGWWDGGDDDGGVVVRMQD